MYNIGISKLIESLKEVDWDYDFRIDRNKDGSGTLSIPDFIMRDLEWAIRPGQATPKDEVVCRGYGTDYGESECAYWEWTTYNKELAVIDGEYYFEGKPVEVIRDKAGDIVDFEYIDGMIN